MILLADNERPETARMRRLIWTFAAGICPKALPITRGTWKQGQSEINFYD